MASMAAMYSSRYWRGTVVCATSSSVLRAVLFTSSLLSTACANSATNSRDKCGSSGAALLCATALCTTLTMVSVNLTAEISGAEGSLTRVTHRACSCMAVLSVALGSGCSNRLITCRMNCANLRGESASGLPYLDTVPYPSTGTCGACTADCA